jgi:hypothetical protein
VITVVISLRENKGFRGWFLQNSGLVYHNWTFEISAVNEFLNQRYFNKFAIYLLKTNDRL